MPGSHDYDAERAVMAARRIQQHSRDVTDLFPEGSVEGPSAALPAIWEDFDAFADIVDDMGSRADALALAAQQAEDATAIRQPFAALGKTCSGCHEDFRKEN